jgi:membrane protein implicated in regulation of membrane protease activity
MKKVFGWLLMIILVIICVPLFWPIIWPVAVMLTIVFGFLLAHAYQRQIKRWGGPRKGPPRVNARASEPERLNNPEATQ